MLTFAAPFAACRAESEAAAPDPVEPARRTVGRYCHKIMIDHKGPKAQIRLNSGTKPVRFSSVRDGFAFPVPSGAEAGAKAFIARHGGRIVKFACLPKTCLPGEEAPKSGGHDHGTMAHGFKSQGGQK
jgi:nitrous oxide reductase accessory protein NosL